MSDAIRTIGLGGVNCCLLTTGDGFVLTPAGRDAGPAAA